MSDSLPATQKHFSVHWGILHQGHHGLHPPSFSGGQEQLSEPSSATNPVFFEPT